MNTYLLILGIFTVGKGNKNTEKINILVGIIYIQFVKSYFFCSFEEIVILTAKINEKILFYNQPSFWNFTEDSSRKIDK